MKIFDRVCSGVDMAVILLGAVQGLVETGKRFRITIAEFDKRSLPQNNLYWEWMSRMSNFFGSRGAINDKGQRVSKEDMHDLMRHMFLGYVEKRVGNTKLEPQLKSTTDLSKSEMSEYMIKVEVWAAECKCYLPRPEDNEYTQYREAMRA